MPSASTVTPSIVARLMSAGTIGSSSEVGLHQGAVELHVGDAVAAHRERRGVAGAEVVDRDRAAQLPQRRELGARAPGPVDLGERRLGDVEPEPRPGRSRGRGSTARTCSVVPDHVSWLALEVQPEQRRCEIRAVPHGELATRLVEHELAEPGVESGDRRRAQELAGEQQTRGPRAATGPAPRAPRSRRSSGRSTAASARRACPRASASRSPASVSRWSSTRRRSASS